MLFGDARPAVNYRTTEVFFNYSNSVDARPLTVLAVFYSLGDASNNRPRPIYVTKFRLSPNIVYTIPMWFAEISKFLTESRNHNYSGIDTVFPVPIFEDQNHTNFFVFVLFVLNHLHSIDAAAIASIAQSILKPLLKLGLGCIGEKHRILVLDLCFQLTFRPACSDNGSALKILINMLKNDDMAEYGDLLSSQLREFISSDAPNNTSNCGPAGHDKSHFYLFCTSLTARAIGHSAPVYRPLASYYQTLYSNSFTKIREIGQNVEKHGLNAIFLHHVTKLQETMFFKKQSRLANQRCTIFAAEDESVLRNAQLVCKRQKHPIYLIISTHDDDIRVYRIQFPRRIRDTHTILPVHMGAFNPQTFFNLFLGAGTTHTNNSIIQVPIFSELSWQDCFLLFEMYIMNHYINSAAVPLSLQGGGTESVGCSRKRRLGASREKVIDMTKCISKYVAEESDIYRNNLCTTYNAYLLVFYHIWYLYNHQRLETFSHSWQSSLYNRHYLNSYRIVCNLTSINDILLWIYNSNTNQKMRSHLRIKRIEHGPFTFGPFDYKSRGRAGAAGGRFVVSYNPCTNNSQHQAIKKRLTIHYGPVVDMSSLHDISYRDNNVCITSIKHNDGCFDYGDHTALLTDQIAISGSTINNQVEPPELATSARHVAATFFETDGFLFELDDSHQTFNTAAHPQNLLDEFAAHTPPAPRAYI